MRNAVAEDLKVSKDVEEGDVLLRHVFEAACHPAFCSADAKIVRVLTDVTHFDRTERTGRSINTSCIGSGC